MTYEFPVGVGDKLYDLLWDNKEWEVMIIEIHPKTVLFRLGVQGTDDYSAVHLKEIGERRFLTLEEAQEAYKKHEAKHR